MAIAKVNSLGQGSATGNAFGPTSSIDTTGSSAILVAITDFSGDAASTVTDSVSNSYGSPIVTAIVEGNVRLQIWVKASPTTNAAHTWTTGGATTNPSIAVLALSGTATASPVDTSISGVSTGTTTVQPGSLTPGQVNCAVVALFAAADSETAVTAPFTPADKTVASTGTAIAIALGALDVQTTATARNPTWTAGGTGDKIAFSVSIKPAAAATGSIESLQPLSQPTSHYRPEIIMSSALRATLGSTPWLPTLPTRVQGTLDWMQSSVDVVWL